MNPFAFLGGMFGGAEAMAADMAAMRLAHQQQAQEALGGQFITPTWVLTDYVAERHINRARPAQTCSYCATQFIMDGKSCGCGANRPK